MKTENKPIFVVHEISPRFRLEFSRHRRNFNYFDKKSTHQGTHKNKIQSRIPFTISKCVQATFRLPTIIKPFLEVLCKILTNPVIIFHNVRNKFIHLVASFNDALFFNNNFLYINYLFYHTIDLDPLITYTLPRSGRTLSVGEKISCTEKISRKDGRKDSSIQVTEPEVTFGLDCHTWLRNVTNTRIKQARALRKHGP